MIGLGIVGGVGFTVSLFIVGLSFPGNDLLVADAKVGVLGASVLAAWLGLAYLWLVTRSAPEGVQEPLTIGRGLPG